jgi:hypothetical protein
LRHDWVRIPFGGGSTQRKRRGITSTALYGALKRVLDVAVSATSLMLLTRLVLLLEVAGIIGLSQVAFVRDLPQKIGIDQVYARRVFEQAQPALDAAKRIASSARMRLDRATSVVDLGVIGLTFTPAGHAPSVGARCA